MSPQDGLCWFVNGDMQGCLVNRVDGTKIFPNKMPEIKVGTFVFRNQDTEFERSLKNGRVKRQIAVDLNLKTIVFM